MTNTIQQCKHCSTYVDGHARPYCSLACAELEIAQLEARIRHDSERIVALHKEVLTLEHQAEEKPSWEEIGQMNETIQAQGKRIAELEARCRKLADHLKLYEASDHLVIQNEEKVLTLDAQVQEQARRIAELEAEITNLKDTAVRTAVHFWNPKIADLEERLRQAEETIRLRADADDPTAAVGD